MRDILFRGKRVDNGEWVYSSFIMQDKEHKLLSTEVELFDGDKWRVVAPETVGQFTGLTDRRGKKIFEGDIIKGKRLNAMVQIEHRKYLIIFSNGSFCAEWYIGQDNYNNDLHDFFDRKVIGNIHDNPELLEVKK